MNSRPSSGTWFHSLQATSQALQPMQIAGVGEEAHPGLGLVAVALGPAQRLARAPGSMLTRLLGPRLRPLRGKPRPAAQRAAPRAPARPDVAGERLRPPRCARSDRAPCAKRSFAATPVVSPRVPQWYGSPTWCTGLPSTRSGRDAVGDEHARLDRRARGDDRRPAAVDEPALAGQRRGDLEEHLGLQLGEIGHDERDMPPAGVVLGQPVGGHDVRVASAPGSPSTGCTGPRRVLMLLAARVRALLVERIVERRLVGLVVGRQRPVVEPGGDEQPALARRPA